PARHDQRMPFAESDLERRKIHTLREQTAFVAQVLERVLREALERLGHPPALLGERPPQLTGVEAATVRAACAVAKEACPADGHVLAVADLVEERRPRGIDQPHAAAHE